SLGSTYFELLTGRPPFQGETGMATIYQQCHVPLPDPCEIAPDLPERCARILQHALDKDPAQRYQKAAQMLTDLDLVLAGRGPNALSAPERSHLLTARRVAAAQDTVVLGPTRRMRRWWLAALLLLAVAIGAALLFWQAG